MILEKLYVCDFRVFKGEETIQLAPRVRKGRKRPIILFGGLNGAGKTTTLTAVRLALYGRHSLGRSVSIKEYHQYLKQNIHISRDSLVQAKAAKIHLTFSYASRGEVSRYTVKREWEVDGKLSETLKIERDDELLKELSYEQCQGFLNELIPIGVSDLFFFDGEKIAELAEDNSGHALGAAIRKLLGLDVINRMRDDLSIYLREKNKAALPETYQVAIAGLEEDYKEAYATYQQAREKMDQALDAARRIDTDIRQSETFISSKGGAWARSRADEQQRIERLVDKKKQLENQVRECMAGAYPLSLAAGQLGSLLTQLENESEYKKQQLLKVAMNKKLNALKKALSKTLDNPQQVDSAVNDAFASIFSKVAAIDVIHDCSEREFSRMAHLVKEVLPQAQEQMARLGEELSDVQAELDMASKNLERAPDKEFLQQELDELRQLNAEKSEYEKKAAIAQEEAKKHLRVAMDLMRKIQKKEGEFSSNFSGSQAYLLATRSRDLLNDFAQQTTQNKVKQLEQAFVKTFSRLARKDDISLRAEIDPKTFNVKLFDKSGKEINKQQLSAGEKQIFAIAILEALAKTSGRKLPVIIDTPLGRLDSKHRAKLVENYFPTASHQVIILSTDTEIDKDYYKILSPHISHIYEVQYFPEEGNSEFLEKRYFGSQLEEEQEVVCDVA